MAAYCPRLAPHAAVAQGLTLNGSLPCPSAHRLWEEPALSLQRLRSLGHPSLAKPSCKYPLDVSRFCAGNINLSTAGGTVAPPSREPVLSYTNAGLVLGKTASPPGPGMRPSAGLGAERGVPSGVLPRDFSSAFNRETFCYFANISCLQGFLTGMFASKCKAG